MREDFQFRLDRLSDHRTLMALVASDAMRDATTALLTSDVVLASKVIGQETFLNDMLAQGEQVSLDLLAREAPVASDLRRVVSALWIVSNLHRMGILAVHVARTAERRGPDTEVPAEVRTIIEMMGQVAVHLSETAGRLLNGSDVSAAASLESEDDLMDTLHRQLFDALFAADWSHGVAAAIDFALLGRYYERFADQAVAVSRRVVFVITGENIGGDRTAAALDATSAIR
ncbi:phosphate transport system regulatory protein PhoU [Nakamurella silvestris]|nr:phosphate transport system regulatory protein PhoU [Nakamurella silvestris]